jgi:hypothetical protein
MSIANLFHMKIKQIRYTSKRYFVVLGNGIVIVLATEPKIRGFKPGRQRWIFRGDTNPQYTFLSDGK